MFDRSFLPPADLEFVVMTDTHYMLDPGSQRIEFESRRRQSSRSAHALRLVASLEPAFVVHLGDLVQEFPESDGFAQSLGEALAQLDEAGVRPCQVAGNHDVGDKPDPTMPTDWVTPGSLRQYHERFGRSWYGWNETGCHFIVLNSQIMNGDLPEAAAQARWLERDLAAHEDMPTFVFLHLAPFLHAETEQALGHYDNIDEPARSWLLDLVRKHEVQMVFSGHSHFAFFNRIGEARSWVVPSTSFTRPGFCEVFSSAPPPERGRDDASKLGFFLVRVREQRASVHLIRTNGALANADAPRGERRLVSRTSRELERSPLGVTLRHPLAPSAEVPIAWQSTIRQPVRNDYPLLACLELGVRHVRVPAADLANPQQRERLAVLRDEGVSITASWIWSERSPFAEEVAAHRDLLDGMELQLPGRLAPDESCLKVLRLCTGTASMPVSLAPLLPREVVPGKQHARTRIGFNLDEIGALDRFLGEAGVHVDRVLCRVGAHRRPWDTMGEAPGLPALQRIGALDWAVEFDGPGQHGQVARAAEAMAGAALGTTTRLFLEPLVDLDRTMDTPLGLLDRLCNPRPVFHVVRTLNTILHSARNEWRGVDCPPVAGAATLALESVQGRILLVLPLAEGQGEVAIPRRDVHAFMPGARSAKLIRLETGVICPLDIEARDAIGIPGATAIVMARGDPPTRP